MIKYMSNICFLFIWTELVCLCSSFYNIILKWRLLKKKQLRKYTNTEYHVLDGLLIYSIFIIF